MNTARIDALNIIEALSNAPGAPGFEDDVVAILRREGGAFGAVSEDSLRNCYIRREENTGGAPTILLDAHSDEVAFMVQAIRPNGTLQFIPLGGWLDNAVPAHKVRVRTADGSYRSGVIASKPPHFMTEEEKKRPVPLSELVIDVGARSREEAMEDFGIRIGEPVVPDVDFSYDEHRDLMIGKAFDCRLGCAALLGTLKELRGELLPVDVIGAVAAQEEVGTRGAAVTAKNVAPAAAIVFEGCPADDTFAEPYAVQTAIKRGPMLRHIDARMITNPRFQRFALSLGEELGIPVQEAVRSGGSTNGAPIHLSNLGVPCIVIGLPVRYIHSHYGIASLFDYEAAVSLASSVLRRLTPGIIAGF